MPYKLTIYLLSSWLLGSLVLGCSEANLELKHYAKLYESCTAVEECTPGLICDTGQQVCLKLTDNPTPTKQGEPCNSDEDCKDSYLNCSKQKVCSKLSLKPKGAGYCNFTLECAGDYICKSSGICDDCSNKATIGCADKGEACDLVKQNSCRRPYVCGINKECTTPPFIEGPTCLERDEEPLSFRLYFQIPSFTTGVSDKYHDFYRLPFPSNIRVLTDGTLFLNDHAYPGPILELDLKETYFKTISQDFAGFALNAPIFVRFSDLLDLNSVCLSKGSSLRDYDTSEDERIFFTDETNPCTANISLVNISKNSPNYGENIPLEALYGSNAGLFICQDWLGVIPLPGKPLAPNTTYALILDNSLRNFANEPPEADADFKLMLQDSPPNGTERPELVRAYEQMAPLRAWLRENSHTLDGKELIGGTVFTTGEPTSIASKLFKAVASLPPPNLTQITEVCTGSVPGFLENCNPPRSTCKSSLFKEFNGVYDNPVWQHGVRPYSTSGGTLEFDAHGDLLLNPERNYEPMCFSLSVDKNLATPPAAGFPVLIFGHGTGGNFRSILQEPVASKLTSGGFAILSFDNVLHGRRLNEAGILNTTTNNNLETDAATNFFNLMNPAASRDNILQGSADLLYLIRLVKEAAAEFNAAGIKLDTTRIFYFGHSQGAAIAPPFISLATGIQGIIQSGASADLALSLLYKNKPLNIADIFSAFFGDRNLSRIHPLMGLISLLFASVDALSYAPLYLHNNYLQIIGDNDSYAPLQSQQALIRAGSIPLVKDQLTPSFVDISISSENVSQNLHGYTIGAVRFLPPTTTSSIVTSAQINEGHFVYTTVAEAMESILNFLTQNTITRAP